MRAALLCIVMAGCLGGSDVDVELGRIVYEDDVPQITVDSSASVGRPVHVTVVTYGGGCVHLERTDVEETQSGVEIYPMVTRPAPDALCTRELRLLEHSVTITFSTPGIKLIDVFGRGQGNVMLRVPLSITVAP